MVPENFQTQTKPKHTGLWVLLAIILVVIFIAYALSQRRTPDNSGTPNLTKSEREAIVESLKNSPPPLTESEKQAILKEIANDKPKPLTDAERQAIISEIQR